MNQRNSVTVVSRLQTGRPGLDS